MRQTDDLERNRHLEDVAVAIQYQFGSGGEAPRIIASGRGLLARRIIEIARENEVPVSKEGVLAEALAKVPIGLEVPQELWEAMAEVLAHLYRLDGSMSHDR